MEDQPTHEITQFHKLGTDSIMKTAPIMIEISGMPNAGKTTTLNQLNNFFETNHIPHITIFEHAASCPIYEKLDPLFFYWTAFQMLSDLAEAITQHKSVIVCERGMFDAIVWLNFHKNAEHITNEQYQSLLNLLLTPLPNQPKSFVCLMTCTTNCSLQREQNKHERKTYGRIVNKEILPQLYTAIQQTQTQYRTLYDHFISIDTSLLSIEQMTSLIITELSDCIPQK